MRDRQTNRSGFTLIEVIATLLLTSLAAVFAGMLLTTSMQIYLLGRATAEDSQKVQAAMNRVIKEIAWADPASISASGQAISWRSAHPDHAGAPDRNLTWDGEEGSPLLLNGTPLLDGVAAFEARVPSGGAVRITLATDRVPGVTHTTDVHSRFSQIVF